MKMMRMRMVGMMVIMINDYKDDPFTPFNLLGDATLFKGAVDKS